MAGKAERERAAAEAKAAELEAGNEEAAKQESVKEDAPQERDAGDAVGGFEPRASHEADDGKIEVHFNRESGTSALLHSDSGEMIEEGDRIDADLWNKVKDLQADGIDLFAKDESEGGE